MKNETAAHLPFNILHGGCQKVNRERIEKQFHKDNLRHLSRFPDFFLTFRIIIPVKDISFIISLLMSWKYL